MELDRRALVKGIGAVGTTMLFTGFASANDGDARYIVHQGDGSAVDGSEFTVLNTLADGTVALVKGPEDAADALRAIDGVSAARRDIAVELDGPALESGESAVDVPDSPEDVYDELLWDKQLQQVREAHAYATGAGRTIAIVDTGIDHDHPDLDVDVERSVAVVDGQLANHTGDTGDHGTHVAGIAAGTGDALMTGTAPDATLVSVRVIGGDSGAFGDIMVGMEYAGEIGADAANISLGFMSPPEDDDVDVGAYRQLFEPVANRARRRGTLLVGSGGNDETNLQGGWLRLWNGLAGVAGVSATGPNDKLSFYSNYGTNDIDVAAPGGGYETAEKSAIEDPDEVAWPAPLNYVFSTVPDGGYDWFAGTSMAAPQVAGLAALVRELEPGANPQQLLKAIRQGAEGEAGGGDPEFGAGRANALQTVERVTGDD
jgi:lantibiotic leader peptide-processing serine protease